MVNGDRALQIDSPEPGLWRGRFTAMASPCEILVCHMDADVAEAMIGRGADEAWRIETTFSRYRSDNTIHRINNACGASVEVDAELAALLDYADQCHRLSDGRFDISSGVLRRVWRFDGSDRLPRATDVEALLPLIGWHKAVWRKPLLTLPEGMEIDLGGLGKEYAVDRALLLMDRNIPVLVNFGGDLACRQPRANGRPWRVAIEAPDQDTAPLQLHLSCGAIATSGDSRRFLLKDGVRYPHILDPRVGWPVLGAPRSVTVVAPTCIEAGFLSTLAMLLGTEAENFLQEQGVEHLVLR